MSPVTFPHFCSHFLTRFCAQVGDGEAIPAELNLRTMMKGRSTLLTSQVGAPPPAKFCPTSGQFCPTFGPFLPHFWQIRPIYGPCLVYVMLGL